MTHAVSRRQMILGLGAAVPAAAIVALTADKAAARGGRDTHEDDIKERARKRRERLIRGRKDKK